MKYANCDTDLQTSGSIAEISSISSFLTLTTTIWILLFVLILITPEATDVNINEQFMVEKYSHSTTETTIAQSYWELWSVTMNATARHKQGNKGASYVNRHK